MQRKKAKKIDRDLCQRTYLAFKRLGMNYDQIARDAKLPSKSQLVEVANGVMEPSKRILRYLISKGFSAQWLLAGQGTVLWIDRNMTQTERAVLLERLREDLAAVKTGISDLVRESEDLRKLFLRISSRP